MTTPMSADEHRPQPQGGYPRGIALQCPHCARRVVIRTSRQVSETFREAWAICDGCGFKGKAHVAWDAEASPSLLPNPKVHLPAIAYQDAVAQFATEEIAASGAPQMDIFANTG